MDLIGSNIIQIAAGDKRESGGAACGISRHKAPGDEEARDQRAWSIDIPTRIMRGDDDQVVPLADAGHAKIKQGRLRRHLRDLECAGFLVIRGGVDAHPDHAAEHAGHDLFGTL